MKQLIPMLALALAMPAGAQTFKVTRGTDYADGTLKSRVEKQGFKLKAAKKVKGTDCKKTIGFGGDAISEVEKYGTLRLVMEEDFSLMTDGSIEEPAKKVKLEIPMDSEEYTYPWWNLKPEFTHIPHWGTGAEDPGYACPAGGCYYMEMVERDSWMGEIISSQAKINTPPLKVDEDGGTAVLEFRARTRNVGETYDYLLVGAAETHDMGPTWSIPEEEILVTGIPAEWTTYRIVFRDCGPTTLFNIVGVGVGNVYIDDVKIYQLVPKVMYPAVLPHSDYKGTSFTANWEPVEGADSYLVTVYLIDEDGNRVDVYKDVPVTDTHYNVTGVESGDIYYYTVKAVKGADISLDSFAQRVYDLEVPVMKDPEITGGASYTASWNDVPGADVYNYMAFDKRIAAEDGVFVVTSEDFTDVRDFEGNKTGLTKEDPDVYTISGKFYPQELKQQGWYGESAMPYDDYMAFDAFFYSTNQGQAGFISPEFDMSKDGGKFTIEVDLAAQTDGSDYTTSCIVAVFNWDDAHGDYVQEEMIRLDADMGTILDLNWKKCTFNLTKGTDRTVIGIFAYNSFGNLYVDNLKITQNYKKDEYLIEPFRYARWHGRNAEDNPTSIKVEVPAHAQGLDIYHQVSAFSQTPDAYGQSYDVRESAFSPRTFVMSSVVGIDKVDAEEVDASAEYFTIDGRRVNAPENGIYIVRKGNTVTKVIK